MIYFICRALFFLALLCHGHLGWTQEWVGRAAAQMTFFDSDPTLDYMHEQSIRLIGSDRLENGIWSLSTLFARRYLKLKSSAGVRNGDLVFGTQADAFRWKTLRFDEFEDDLGVLRTQVIAEIDQAVYRHHYNDFVLVFGRQRIDWGSGRFWQPFNVFGSFHPATLEVDYKPGIDAITLEWYRDPLTTLTASYVFSSSTESQALGTDANSGAVLMQAQCAETWQCGLLLANVGSSSSVGIAVEGDWRGMGWRSEVTFNETLDHDVRTHSVVGVDYRFAAGVFAAIEWAHNGFGASHVEALDSAIVDSANRVGLPVMGQDVVGALLQTELTPLWQSSYLLLFAWLERSDVDAALRYSALHQLNIVRSLSNESDLTISALFSTGENSEAGAVPRSEFGSIANRLTLRWRLFF